MKTHCAPVCHTCDQLDLSARCPIDLEKMPNAWKPGDVNKYFHNLTTLEEYKQYEPKVLSSPDYLPGDTEETADYLVGGPWVVVLDNVISEEEAKRIIELGTELGYEQSFAGGKVLPDGTYERAYSDVRTSSNAWCERQCYADPVTKGVIDRITNITQIPEENSEFLQVSLVFLVVMRARLLQSLTAQQNLCHHSCSSTKRGSFIYTITTICSTESTGNVVYD